MSAFRRWAVTDVADLANDVAQAGVDGNIRAASAPFAICVEGDCWDCGEHTKRIVVGRCARCREPKKGNAHA
jgi:hypothetical protein